MQPTRVQWSLREAELQMSIKFAGRGEMMGEQLQPDGEAEEN